MISAEDFIEAGRRLGFQHYTGVPCSFLTPFINYVINDASLRYISSANEGDALATAAGLAMGGKPAVVMMQNSGLGNAVSPLTSLAAIFRIPVLLIATHRGAPGLNDEPQHELMGSITSELFDIMQTPWEFFPDKKEEIAAALERASNFMQKEQRPYAFIMRKGTVAPHALAGSGAPASRQGASEIHDLDSTAPGLPSRQDALRSIIRHTDPDNSVVIATTGYTGRELFAEHDRPNQLYMVGSMGCASSLALGLSLARPDLLTVVIDGDGAALMRMGNFSTLGSYGTRNLVHIVLDNEVHDSTGAQATVSANVDFAAIARACGYSLCLRGNDVDMIDRLFEEEVDLPGPRFAHLKISAGTIPDLPRPDMAPEQVLQRLMANIGTAFK